MIFKSDKVWSILGGIASVFYILQATNLMAISETSVIKTPTNIFMTILAILLFIVSIKLFSKHKGGYKGAYRGG